MQNHNQTTYNPTMKVYHKMQVLNNHIIHFIMNFKNCNNTNKNENLTVSSKKNSTSRNQPQCTLTVTGVKANLPMLWNVIDSLRIRNF